MKKRFTEEQIIGFLRQAEAGMLINELCRKHGFFEASYYLWKNKFGGMSDKGPAGANAGTSEWRLSDTQGGEMLELSSIGC